MQINYQNHLQISMSLDILDDLDLHLTPLLRTIQNFFTIFSSIQKLRTPQTGKQSLKNLFLIYADVDKIGLW